MLLPYKKVGDVLSIDELNGIVYLLKRFGQATETITLTPEGYQGSFGFYSLVIPDGLDFPLTEQGYLITELSNEYLTIIINNIASGRYKITIKVIEGLDLDNVEDESQEPQQNIRELIYYSSISGETQTIYIPISDLNVDSILDIFAEVEVVYDFTEIDKESGGIDDAEDIQISNIDELEGAIINAPENEETTIYIEPGTVIEFNGEIEIENKTIEIVSGSIPATLDAQELGRHFIVRKDGFLKLHNIKLINGKDTIGGSILIESGTTVIGGQEVYQQGQLLATDSRWENNSSTSGNGGAVYSIDGIVSFTNCYFYQNVANGGNGDGGAIFNAPPAN